MNKLFGYAGVSTLDQNLDTQLDALQRAGCDEIFQDKITGMSTSRTALDELQAKLRPGDTVMVARFFRLGRSLDYLITLLSGFAQQRNQIIQALDLGVDSSTPVGKLVLQIFAALAEYDRESLLEKTGVVNIFGVNPGSKFWLACSLKAGLFSIHALDLANQLESIENKFNGLKIGKTFI